MREEEEGRTSRVVVADDHPLFRDALARLVNSSSDLEVVAQAEDGQQAVELCRKLRPDLALLDIAMPKMGGIEATRKLKQEEPSPLVLVVTALAEPDCLLEAVRAGASGYVLKYASAQEMTETIHKVLRGESPLNQGLAMQLFRRLIDEKSNPQRDSRPDQLAADG